MNPSPTPIFQIINPAGAGPAGAFGAERRAVATRKSTPVKERGLKRLPDGRWQWSVKHLGRQIRRTATTKGEAEEELFEARRNIKAGRAPDFREEAPKQAPTLEDAIEEFLSWSEKTKRKGTHQSDKWCSKFWTSSRNLRKKRVDEITAEDLERFKRELADERVSNGTRFRNQPFTKRTQDIILARLKRFFALAVDWGWLPKSPALKVRLYREDDKRCRVLSFEEEDRLFDHALPYLSRFLTFALATGMRKGEILNLRWCDVDQKNGVATIQATRHKGRRDHHYFLNEQALAVLKALPIPIDDRVLIFGNARGNLHSNLERQWRKALAASGISNLHIHDLRHTFASRFLEAGGDLPTLREILGHRDFETTLRYSHIAPTRMKAAVALVLRPEAILRVQKGMSFGTHPVENEKREHLAPASQPSDSRGF